MTYLGRALTPDRRERMRLLLRTARQCGWHIHGVSSDVCLCAGHAVQGPALASRSALAPLLLHALHLAEAVQRALNSSAPRSPALVKPSDGAGPLHGAAGASRGESGGSAWRGQAQCASVLRQDEALALARATAVVDSRRARAALLRLVVLAAPLPQVRRIAFAPTVSLWKLDKLERMRVP